MIMKYSKTHEWIKTEGGVTFVGISDYAQKELGDIAWYLAEAATALDLTLEEILEANIDKLRKRYPDGFETKRSVEREKNDI